jgi:AraC family carnitine catabolism transcriptional activator
LAVLIKSSKGLAGIAPPPGARETAMTSAPYRIGFLLLPEFSYFGLIAAVQPLFLANWRAQRTLFTWATFSADGAPVRASNGMSVAVDSALSGRQALDTLLVLACFDPKQHAGVTRVRKALLRAAAAGLELGGIETGSEMLAAAGLLDGRVAAVHWDNLDGFAERYPKVAARAQLYHAERGRLTCAGGTAVIEMMLYLVGREAGQGVSEEVAQQMLVGRPRPPTRRQLADVDPTEAAEDELVRAAMALMSRNLDEPLSAAELAHRLGVSPRHLRRQFRAATATTTARYHMRLRLSRAHNLLEQTELSVTEVAITCGFRSLEHFSRVYRQAFGCAPSRDRRQSLSAPIYRDRAGIGRSREPRNA